MMIYIVRVISDLSIQEVEDNIKTDPLGNFPDAQVVEVILEGGPK